MYTALIEDQPDKRSHGKAVFTFPLVLLFILVGVASTRHLMNANANNSLESMLAETNFGGAGGAQAGGATVDCTDPSTSPWFCIDKCSSDREGCKVVLTLDMGSSGTKPSLWAIKADKENKKIPEMKLVATDTEKKVKFKGFCGMWADPNQHMGSLESYCDAIKVDTPQYPKECKTPKGTLSDHFDEWKKHFNTQMPCFLDKELTSGGTTKPIKEWISGTYGGVTAGLRNDPNIMTKFSVLLEGAKEVEGTGGELWRLLTKQTGKPVHIRMISGEEEGYYEWISFNWDALRNFVAGNKQSRETAQYGLKNTLTIGGASAQIAIPTEQPMNTLDHTYYFHIGKEKYWIYANSIMWAGTTRLKTMVQEYVKQSSSKFQRVEAYEFLPDNEKENKRLMKDFVDKNDNLLCSDIYGFADKETQLYQSVCVMGFHFPSSDQWLTHQFAGNKDWKALIGKHGKCMEKGKVGDVKLDFNENCDFVPETVKTQLDQAEKTKYWWKKNWPRTTLPFWGRFWNKLSDFGFSTGDLEYSKQEEKSWSAVWAAMWLHGRFQGFPNLVAKRRNLGELKGEYTLGPLTIPAHFGTPEDPVASYPLD